MGQLIENKWPALDGRRSLPESMRVLAVFLKAMGHDPSDFVVQDGGDSQLCREFGLQDRLLVVQCRSTGEDRLYALTDSGSWLNELLHDIAAGCFGPVR